MNEIVLKYLQELSTETRERITSYYSDETAEFAFLVGKLIATLQKFHHECPEYEVQNPKHVAFGLMTKGANTLMAGFELALNGYMWEPSILFRSALEGFAVAWDLVHNETRFTKWNTDKKFDSTISISSVKKEIEPLGKMYGLMSQMHVHTQPLNSSPPMLLSDKDPKFQLFGHLPIGKEGVRKGEVYFALMIGHACLQLTELVFHNYSGELETIEKIPGTDCVKPKVSSRHQRFVDEMVSHFKSIATDSTKSF